MAAFKTKALLFAVLTISLAACNRSPGGEDSAEAAGLGAPVEYTAAEKATIQATFPAPYNTADLAAGEKQFNKCRACHTISPNSMNMTGPHLYGVFGRHSASAAGYTYSDAMKAHNVVWDFKTLDEFLKAPQTVVKGTKMGFMGVPKDDDRRNLIAYLKLETTPKK
jgi:cytochrome c